ncbi:unnamed protein product, partial [marine sediment metagenome]
EVKKVVAEAENGWFCLLPKHVDFTTSLTPGILMLTTPEGKDILLAAKNNPRKEKSQSPGNSTRPSPISPNTNSNSNQGRDHH